MPKRLLTPRMDRTLTVGTLRLTSQARSLLEEILVEPLLVEEVVTSPTQSLLVTLVSEPLPTLLEISSLHVVTSRMSEFP